MISIQVIVSYFTIPDGVKIHNIEMQPGRGGQLCRSAGSSATLMAKEGQYVTIRLPSGEMRKIPQIVYGYRW